MPPAPKSASQGQASLPTAAGRSLQAGPAPALEPRSGTSASCDFRVPRRTPRRMRNRPTAAPRAGPPRPRALSVDPPPAVLAGAHAPSSSDRAPCVGYFLLRSDGALLVAPSLLIVGPRLAGTHVRLEKHPTNTRQRERAKGAHNPKGASHPGAQCGVHTQDVSTRARHDPQDSSRPRTQRGEGSAHPEGCVTPTHSARRRQRTSEECVMPRNSALRRRRTTRRVRHAEALSAAKAAHNPKGASLRGT